MLPLPQLRKLRLTEGQSKLQGRLGITPVTPAGGGRGVRTCLAMAPEQGWTEQGGSLGGVVPHTDQVSLSSHSWLRG